MKGGHRVPRRPGKRLSVADLGAYELYFYAPVAHAAVVVEKDIVLPALRTRGRTFLERMSELTSAYCAAVEELIRDEEDENTQPTDVANALAATDVEITDEEAALPARKTSAAVEGLRRELTALHSAVERALDAVIARGSLWRDEVSKERAERLDAALLSALAEARAEVRRRALATTLPRVLRAGISAEDNGG